jgi:hypothetical protein
MSATVTSRNGPSTNPVGDGRLHRDGGEAQAGEGLPARLVRALAGQVSRRVPPADLDERDPDYIREALPRLWLLSSLWFRGEVRGLGNIPEEGPVSRCRPRSRSRLCPRSGCATSSGPTRTSTRPTSMSRASCRRRSTRSPASGGCRCSDEGVRPCARPGMDVGHRHRPARALAPARPARSAAPSGGGAPLGRGVSAAGLTRNPGGT